MPIHGETVKHDAFVLDAKPEQYRTVGYDLTIGEIYVPKDGWLPNISQKRFRNTIVSSYELPPQGVAVIFSAEAIELPDNVCAYAMPKTSLCARGLLVLNTGIVDPNYRGLLSGTIVNFTDMTYTLRNGDPFLRLTFERIEPPHLAGAVRERQSLSKLERQQYRSDKMANASTFPASFLDIPDTVKLVSEDVLKAERNLVYKLVALLGVMLTLVTLLPTFFPKQLLPPTAITRDEMEIYAKEYAARDTVQKTLDRLSSDVTSLRNELRSELNGSNSQQPRNANQPVPNQ